MGLFIGMDEAGYGPNLGPLVITVTVWEVPGPPRRFLCAKEGDLAAALADVVCTAGDGGETRLQIADSKQVYSPAKGLAALERTVLCALNLCGLYPGGFRELRSALAPHPDECTDTEPWFDGFDLNLPTVKHPVRLSELTTRFSDCCTTSGIRLRSIRSDVMLTRRFNDQTRHNGSKGLTLSRASLRLLRSVWNPDDGEPTMIVADKHGGRNRYDDLLAETFTDGRLIQRRGESTARSDYRVGATDIRFQTKGEAHLPVALASMVSKYVREVAMELFNRFWASHQPGLKPTKGYPGDARRFKDEIAATQAALGIDDDVLWRER